MENKENKIEKSVGGKKRKTPMKAVMDKEAVEVPTTSSKVPRKDIIDDSSSSSEDEDEHRKETLLNGMAKYAEDIVAIPSTPVSEYDREFGTEKKGFDHSAYVPVPYVFIPMPSNKFHLYNELTTKLGYSLESKNNFLRNSGIMSVMCREKPVFRFWDHGLTLYMPSINNPCDRTYKFLFKTSMCTAHEFECQELKGPCEISHEFSPSQTMTFLVSGVFKSRKIASATKSFQTFQIELENSRRIETCSVNISDLLTIKGNNTRVFLLKRCDHKSCAASAPSVPFPGMDMIYHKCSEISPQSEMKADYSGFRCFGYGKGIEGSYHENSNTVFLATWRMIDLYIDNY